MRANPVRNARAAAAQQYLSQSPARLPSHMIQAPKTSQPIDPLALPLPPGLTWVCAAPSVATIEAAPVQPPSAPGTLPLGSAQTSVQADAHRPDIAMLDWELLFVAVTARLRAAAATPLDLASSEQMRATSVRLQQAVRECVTELEHLHRTLEQQLAQHR